MNELQALNSIMDKFPALRKRPAGIILQKWQIRNLNDMEFTALYLLPNVQIQVSKSTLKYIHTRAGILNIKQPHIVRGPNPTIDGSNAPTVGLLDKNGTPLPPGE